MRQYYLTILLVFFSYYYTMAQDSIKNEVITTPVKGEKKDWFQNFSIRGYMQIRYNRLLETNENLKCEQCDRSIGKGGGFIITGYFFISNLILAVALVPHKTFFS